MFVPLDAKPTAPSVVVRLRAFAVVPPPRHEGSTYLATKLVDRGSGLSFFRGRAPAVHALMPDFNF